MSDLYIVLNGLFLLHWRERSKLLNIMIPETMNHGYFVAGDNSLYNTEELKAARDYQIVALGGKASGAPIYPNFEDLNFVLEGSKLDPPYSHFSDTNPAVLIKDLPFPDQVYAAARTLVPEVAFRGSDTSRDLIRSKTGNFEKDYYCVSEVFVLRYNNVGAVALTSAQSSYKAVNLGSSQLLALFSRPLDMDGHMEHGAAFNELLVDKATKKQLTLRVTARAVCDLGAPAGKLPPIDDIGVHNLGIDPLLLAPVEFKTQTNGERLVITSAGGVGSCDVDHDMDPGG